MIIFIKGINKLITAVEGTGDNLLDEDMLTDMKADGKKFEIETTNKWLDGVVREFPSDVYSDGMVLDEVIKLIDEGKCNV